MSEPSNTEYVQSAVITLIYKGLHVQQASVLGMDM